MTDPRGEAPQLFLCRANGEGSHEFRVCKDEAEVMAFYKAMFGEDHGGGIQSQIDHFHDQDNWSNSGTAYECELYCATFEVWKVAPSDLAFAASAKRATVPIKVLPMLVNGQLATDEHGPVILIDSEQGEYEQVVTLWHEVLHLLGMTDEGAVERIAARLAHACDTVLRGLSSNINVPNSAAPLSVRAARPFPERKA
jgi:hypothetical protein